MSGTSRAEPGGKRIDVLLVLLLAVTPWLAYLAGRMVLFFGDTFYYFYPLRHTLAVALRSGYLPDWESAALSGNPFCANPQTNCFYPLSVWYLLPDFFSAYHWSLVSHLAIGGIGTWWWCSRRCGGRLGPLLAAVVFMTGGATLSMINRLDKLQSLCWWPWVMLALEVIHHRPRRGGALLALALAMQFLAGGLEVWAMAVGGCLVWLALAGPPVDFTDRREAASVAHGSAGVPAPDGPRPGRWWVRFGAFGLGLVLCGALTAIQWLPFRELLHWSTRAAGVSFARATEMSMAPADLLGVAFPTLFFYPESLSYRPTPSAGSIPHYFYGLYLGWLPLSAVFAAVPVALRRGPDGRTVRAALVLVLIGGVLALGAHTPVYGLLFRTLPPLQGIRFPEKFLSLSSFFLLPLIACGVNRYRSALAWGTAAALGGGAALGARVVPGYLAAAGAVVLETLVGGEVGAWRVHLLDMAPGLVYQGLLLAGAGVLGLVAIRKQHTWARVGVVIVVATDLWLGTGPLNPPLSRPILERPPALASALSKVFESPRTHVAPVYDRVDVTPPPGLPVEQAYVWFWQLLYPNTGLLSGISYADGSRALRLAHSTRFFATMKGAPPDVQLRLARIAGVDAVVARAPATGPGGPEGERGPSAERLAAAARHGLQFVADAPGWGLEAWKLEGSAPRAYLPDGCVRFDDPNRALAAVVSGQVTPPGEVALLAGPGGDGDGGCAASSSLRAPGASAMERGAGEVDPASVRETPDGLGSFRPVPVRSTEGGKRRVVGPFDLSKPGVLVLAEAWYPGWEARVDGRPVPVLLANGYQQAVTLEPGRHVVVLEYRPRGRGWGVALAVLGSGGVVLLLLEGRFRRTFEA